MMLAEWEVTSEILAVDVKPSLVYFQAANTSSTQCHIYSVPLFNLKSEEQLSRAGDSHRWRVQPGVLRDELMARGRVLPLDISPQLNVLEMLPWRIDDTGRRRYAVLFCVYGGPRSQVVDVRYLLAQLVRLAEP